MITLNWLVGMVFDSISLSYSVSIIGRIEKSRPLVMRIVLIAGDASRARVGLWTLLRCHQGAQLNDETIDIRACSNHASICRFEGSNLNCWLDDVARLGVPRSCRLWQWVLNAAVGIRTRLNRPYAINSFNLWCNSESILVNSNATHWIGVKLVKSREQNVSVYWKAIIV